MCGFNSGKFDFNVMKAYLIPYFLENDIQIINCIKKDSGYMQVATEQLLFLDVSNYLSAGTSYFKWLKSLEVEENKGFWPYEKFSSLNFLDQISLPPIEDFYSTLRCVGITKQDYEYIHKIWKEKGMETMRDLLIWYNNLDSKPMVDGLTEMCAL